MTTGAESLPAGFGRLAHPARTGTLRTTSGTTRWATWGGRSAPAVLLLPSADDLYGWSPRLVELLVARGLRVVGFEPPPAVAERPAAVAAVAAALLGALDIHQAVVVGSSQGGLTAQALAAGHAGSVAGLVVLMSRHPTTEALDIDTDLLAALAPPRRGRPDPGRHERAASLCGAGTPDQAEAARTRADEAARAGADPVTAMLAFAAGEDAPQPVGWRGRSVVVHGSDDPVVPVAAGRDLARRVGAELVVVPGGHDLPWGAELEVAEAVVGLVPSPVDQRRRWTRAWWAAAAAVLVLGGAIGAAATIQVPYYAITPGSARAVDRFVTVPGDRHNEPEGTVLFVTVGVRKLTYLGKERAERDSAVDVVHEDVITGGRSRSDYQEQTVQDMVDSQQRAAVVALRRLCHTVVEHGTGARVTTVSPGSPAAEVVRPREVITGVDGRPVRVADDLLAAIRSRRPGATVTLRIEPDEAAAEGAPAARDATVRLAARPDDPARPFLGVSLVTRQQRFDLPFPVQFDTGRVGGPSAGLAFTLTVLDLLTAGELTGGTEIAVTGTIELDGRVGPVGGLRQKAIAVARHGARVFIVPAEDAEYEQARKAVGNRVRVIPVRTVDEAIAALRELGGDASAIPDRCG